MTSEIESIVHNLENVNAGDPWFGRAVYELLDETDPQKAFIKPNNTEHSLVELIYHMVTWAAFTLHRIEGSQEMNSDTAAELDWRKIDPSKHSWNAGLAEFKEINNKIVTSVARKDDAWLEQKVEYRKFNFRYLVNGLIQHNIYHLGQIAYLNKLL